MGPWPFDRLLTALADVCAEHDVFVQTGVSTIAPPCPHAPFLGFEETQRRIARADVVITHGGNTVRLVQRSGRIPIAVAREAARDEMRNDHQVAYLLSEVAEGRVVALDGDLRGLAEAVSRHPEHERALLRSGSPPPPGRRPGVGDLLDVVAGQDETHRRGSGARPSGGTPPPGTDGPSTGCGDAPDCTSTSGSGTRSSSEPSTEALPSAWSGRIRTPAT